MTTNTPTGPGQVPDYDDDPFAPRQDHEDSAELNGRRVTIAPMYSDEAITLEFVDQHEKRFRYVTQFGKWFVWDENRWLEDVQLRVLEWVRNACRGVSNVANGKPGLSRAIASAKTSGAVERLLRSEQQLNLLFEYFDRDTMLLNTPSGIVDLSTGDLLPHAREHYLTKMTAVGPTDMATPLWNKFLSEITMDRPELVAFLQRMAGYCLTAETREHAMFFLYGTGTNGKSVFLNTLFKMMGDYVKMSNIENFMMTEKQQHSTGIASLMGARMVWTTEIGEGKKWETSVIKGVTGGDPITARFMRQDNFTYIPTFKLVCIGNFKPQFKSVGPAMQRRMNLIPFEADFSATMDKELENKMRIEWPGILRWAINGCIEWHKKGLQPPPVIQLATKNYLEAEDNLGTWLEECIRVNTGAAVTQHDLWRSWESWSKARGDHPGQMKRFLAALEQKDIVWEKDPKTNIKMAHGYVVVEGGGGSSQSYDPGPSGPNDRGFSSDLDL